MKAIWIKLIRDSFFHKGKIIYLLLAQLIAFFGLSSVYMGNIMVKKDFQENFAKSQPAHLILTYPPEHHPTEFHPLTHPMLSGGEERPMALGEIQTEEGRYMKTLFIGVESIQSPQVNKFSLTHPSASANIYLEQNGSYFFDEEYLENIHIISNANDTTELGPAAWVHDTRLPPSRMEHTLYAYLPISLFNQHFPQATHRWIFKTRINPSDKEGLLKLGNDIKKNWEEAYDLQASFNIPSQDHPHQNIADGIFYLMKLLGGSLGVLGGVFMILILLTWLYPQIPDIGTLKSLGATQGDIQSAYLLFILLLSVIIWIPAAGLGYLVAKAFNTFIAFTQNFSPVENPVSIWQFLSLFGICMAIPVLLSFFPIQSAVRKSVLNAQQWVFTTSHKSLRWISKWFPAARHVYVGNNLLHNLFLFLLSLMLVVTGLSITLSGFNLTQSLKKEMDSLEKNRLFDYAIDVHQADSLSVSGPGF
ncbi:MAG: ABC transporter permease, partial [Bacteroidota bacterium]